MAIEAELNLVKVNVFLMASYILGTVAAYFKTSAILGHMLVGALLGPGFANFAPHPHGLEMAGLLGIQLEVVETGLATNLGTLKRLAPRALLIGVLGIILPLVGAVGVVVVLDVIEKNFNASESVKVAFAVGAALAPTSLGVTATLLDEQGELDTELGQLISLSALFDDVLSLILLALVQAAAKDITAWSMLRPIVFSSLFIIGSGIGAYFLPSGLNWLMPRAPLKENNKWRLGLFLICGTTILASYVAYIAGTSFLLAAYLTGVAFADADETNFIMPWRTHVRQHIKWLVLLFFAASIGFVIPLKDLFSPAALGPGAVLSIIAVLGKLVSGFGAKTKADAVAVGFGMLARGEFGFLIASQGFNGGILNNRMYAATIWGVLIPTVVTPIFFGPVFRWRARQLGLDENDDEDDEYRESRISGFPDTGSVGRRSLDSTGIARRASVGKKSLDSNGNEKRESRISGFPDTGSVGRRSLDVKVTNESPEV